VPDKSCRPRRAIEPKLVPAEPGIFQETVEWCAATAGLSNVRFVPSSLKQNDTARDYTVQRLIPSIKWEE